MSKESPRRRKSIASINQNKPPALPRAKRRPHSIVPGDRLSPFAKARRSLAPRKSILKTFTNILNNNTDASPKSQPSSQLEEPSSDDASSQPTDNAKDSYSVIQDNLVNRRSLGNRRVSFAENVLVRLITKDRSDGPATPESSFNAQSPQAGSQTQVDEIFYPGELVGGHRRSSGRRSLSQSEDMDITTIAPQTFVPKEASALLDEDVNANMEQDTMEITEAIGGELAHKSSHANMWAGHGHPTDEAEHSLSSDDIYSSSDDPDQSQLMDFTVPLSKSKRAPVEHDAAWLALRKATHSGDTPIEQELSSDDVDPTDGLHPEDDMDLNDAVQRLMHARQSLPSILASRTDNDTDTLSTESSWNQHDDITVNISTVLGHTNLDLGQTSVGSVMDESGVYGTIAVPTQSNPHTASPQAEPVQQASTVSVFNVFQPPSHTLVQLTQAVPTGTSELQGPRPPPSLNATSRSILAPSPSKMRKPVHTGFSAAFAPPVARPSPKRPRLVNEEQSDIDLERPSPVKRLAVIRKSDPKLSQQPSPSKVSLFQAEAKDPSNQRPSTSLRRPSNYFANRKSLTHSQQLTQIQDKAQFQAEMTESRLPHLSTVHNPNPREDSDQDKSNHHGNDNREVPLNQQSDEHVFASTSTSDPSPFRPSPLLELPSRFPTTLAPESSSHNGREEEDEHYDSVDPTEQWRNTIQLTDHADNDNQSISIKVFFIITGIKFMDELTAPRRSMYLSQPAALQPRSVTEIPLEEYVIAVGMDMPQLVLYSRVSKDLETWIEKSKIDFEQAEDEASKITPELFIEYSRADENGQSELLHQLQLIRTNTRALAKSDWYDWKLQWLDGLRVTADQTFKALEEDAEICETFKTSLEEILPFLQLEYDEIMKELERETAEVAEIEACDQEYLNELKASIAEQNIEVEALRAEVAESKAKLLSLKGRLDGTNIEKQEAEATINDARHTLHVQRNGTRAEVFRLKDELESLERLHMFRILRVEPEMFEYLYAAQFRVKIPCSQFTPIPASVEVSRVEKAKIQVKDNFPSLSNFLLQLAKAQVIPGESISTRQIVHRLNDYWSSCAQLRAQFNLLLVKFPVEIEASKISMDNPTFTARVMVLFPTVKAKAFVSFIFTNKTISYWPMAMRSLRFQVEIMYGDIDRVNITTAIMNRLNQASPENSYACLLDACIEAQELYH